MKKIIICSLFLIIFNTNINITEARQGCCSHHGGVCGCECCDGSSLSATCAPYYPECSGDSDYYKPSPKIKYTAPNQASQNLNNIPELPNLPELSNLPTESSNNKNNDDSNVWVWIIAIGGVGFISYLIGESKRDNK